jgi:hypothetical protein
MHEWLRDITEALQFIEAKDIVAKDENFRDLTNLKGKTQKFQAFNAELTGYGGRVDAILAAGKVCLERMAASGFFSDCRSPLPRPPLPSCSSDHGERRPLCQ